ncbi:segregation and condensation protein A [Agathobaculum sp.]|uniref:segregation and condensation protein A n=1 Tax=Agathobaculum sp. TaxID=2048138 RepID=UPI002A7F404B|nr:segregation/condensation protein A [Agathobaculum sp.]MDY3618962.1 segregation/condensation protein A [Agathobaculum sp.]
MELEFHLDHFDGPLDLLLHLISKNKVSIYDIPIAEILEQYLEVLHEAHEMDMDVAGDFVAMAAQLVYIKSKMLLPRHEEEEEEDPRAGLVEMLLEYQRLKEVAPFFRDRGELGRDIFIKQPEQLPDTPRPEYHHSVDDLVRSADNMLQKALRRVPPSAKAFSGIVGKEPVPVATRIASILKRFFKSARLKFQTLFDDAKNRSEIVATFLAVLELSKTRRILLEGEGEEVELTLTDDKESNLYDTTGGRT